MSEDKTVEDTFEQDLADMKVYERHKALEGSDPFAAARLRDANREAIGRASAKLASAESAKLLSSEEQARIAMKAEYKRLRETNPFESARYAALHLYRK